MAEPEEGAANVHLWLFHPVSSPQSFSEAMFERNVGLETGRREGVGMLHLENLKVSELARYVSKKPLPV